MRRMLKRLYLTALIIIIIAVMYIPPPAAAQVNIEQRRKKLDRNGLAAGVELYFTLNQGNTDAVKFDNSGSLVFRANRHLTFLLARFSMGEKSGARFINKGMGHLRYNYMLSPAFFWEIFTQSEYNEFILLNFRGLVGTGARFILAGNDNINAVCGLAVMGEYEELDDDAPKMVISRLTRASSYISVIISLSDAVDFGNIIYIQPSLQDIEDIRILNDANLICRITNRFSFKTSLSLRFDNQPPDNVKKHDLEVNNGLVWDF